MHDITVSQSKFFCNWFSHQKNRWWHILLGIVFYVVMQNFQFPIILLLASLLPKIWKKHHPIKVFIMSALLNVLQFDIHKQICVSAAVSERHYRRDLATNSLNVHQKNNEKKKLVFHFNDTFLDFTLQICFQAFFPKFLKYAPIIQYTFQWWNTYTW